jgi:hypothetical protein
VVRDLGSIHEVISSILIGNIVNQKKKKKLKLPLNRNSQHQSTPTNNDFPILRVIYQIAEKEKIKFSTKKCTKKWIVLKLASFIILGISNSHAYFGPAVDEKHIYLCQADSMIQHLCNPGNKCSQTNNSTLKRYTYLTLKITTKSPLLEHFLT